MLSNKVIFSKNVDLTWKFTLALAISLLHCLGLSSGLSGRVGTFRWARVSLSNHLKIKQIYLAEREAHC